MLRRVIVDLDPEEKRYAGSANDEKENLPADEDIFYIGCGIIIFISEHGKQCVLMSKWLQ